VNSHLFIRTFTQTTPVPIPIKNLFLGILSVIERIRNKIEHRRVKIVDTALINFKQKYFSIRVLK